MAFAAPQAATSIQPNPQTEISALTAFPVREPVSRRCYTILKLQTRGGLTGYGECATITAADLAQALAAVAGGLPTVNIGRRDLAVARIDRIEGILNGTTNFILTRMAENGMAYADALKIAQDNGIAETDPSGDIDGWDAAVKVSALVTVLMGTPLKPGEVDRKGIRSLTPEDIRLATQAGQRWKLVCTASRVADKVTASVQPELVGPESPLYNVSGTSSIITFETDVLPQLSIVEGNPGPETTAYGLLADLINITR